MSGTSATGGYVIAQPPPPATSEELSAALQRTAAVLSGLPGHLVRHRWLPTPPVQPTVETTWAAIGITKVDADEYPYIFHVGGQVYPGQSDPGYDVMQRHLTITVDASFYGPDAEEASGRLRDGL